MHSLRNISRISYSSWRSVIHGCRLSSAAAAPEVERVVKMQLPPQEGSNAPENPKLVKLVNEIAALNLLEVSELSGLLKTKLNLPDASFMPMAGVGVAAAAPADEEEVATKVVQTAFKVKLMKFDEKQKVALIKEVKNLLEGMNLVQAKKFVESAPALVKEDIPKDEAEKLKEALTKVGAEIVIE
ncbi:large ribosomal subunit protein bL12m [Phlebotomus argentipes]|uniref:large ribosomal subunit protein bL12m n=1 Tax=Phlebotomus argentipes TaxID=94469 RepID=UPI00289382CF|nr:large ribosomal subunit protein bL12m [Phlebotomus argentipes]